MEVEPTVERYVDDRIVDDLYNVLKEGLEGERVSEVRLGDDEPYRIYITTDNGKLGLFLTGVAT